LFSDFPFNSARLAPLETEANRYDRFFNRRRIWISRSLATRERVLESGQADFISMSRPFICQPNLVNEMEKSDQNPILCSNCNRCSIEVLVHQNPLRCYNLNVRKKANEQFVRLGNDTMYNRTEIPL
jgi:hypothetical protein